MRYRPSVLMTTRLLILPFPACRGRRSNSFPFMGRWPEGPEGRAPGPDGGVEPASLAKRAFHSFGGRVDDVEAFDLPRVQREDRPAQPSGERDLAQCSPTMADRDHAVRGGDDHRVARLAQSGRDRE